jgi:hypothetical protein
MTLNLTRLIAAVALIVPAAALVSSPVLAATSTKSKHHVSVHKASSHKTAHHKKAVSATS